MEVSLLKRCCCCLPLRPGIIIFGVLNVLFSITVVICLFVMTDLHRAMITNDITLEAITSTILFTVFGMGVLLNILLIVACCKNDLHLFRLYTYYAALKISLALIPACILTTQLLLTAAVTSFLALVSQCYLILLVRSEIIKLENKRNESEEEIFDSEVEELEPIDISEEETLV